VRAVTINEEMKLAATHALAMLARQDVPDAVRRCYDVESLQFGPEYIIPKPFDTRVLTWVAPAVAKAAMDTGVAQQPVDLDQYREALERRLGKSQEIMRVMIHKAQRATKRVVFPEGQEDKILRAAQILVDENIAQPVLLGDASTIQTRAEELGLHFDNRIEIVDPARSPERENYIDQFWHLRQRKGITRQEAARWLTNPTRFGALMLHAGHVDALIAGLTQHYPDTIRPALEVIPLGPGHRKVSSMYLLITAKGQVYFLTDTTVNIEPSAEDLAEIAIMAADGARSFDVDPRVALLSFSNFGSARHPLSDKVSEAVKLIKRQRPDLVVDGEMQADTAVTPEIIDETYAFSALKGGANVLVFPSLEAANIAYKLLARIGGCEAIGPILMGLSKPVHVLQRGAEVNDIVHMAALAVVQAQTPAAVGTR